MDSNTLFRWFSIIVISAIVHSVILFLVIGLPMPGMFSRGLDPELLQFAPPHQYHFQSAPVADIKENELPAVPVENPTPHKTVHSKKSIAAAQPKSVEAAESAEHKAKVIDVKFEEPAAEPKATAETSPKATEPTAAVEDKKDETDEADDATATASEEPTPSPAMEETKTSTGDLKPVQDKVAGVQAADDEKDSDEATEAVAPEANPASPAETEPASSVVDKSENPQDN